MLDMKKRKTIVNETKFLFKKVIKKEVGCITCRRDVQDFFEKEILLKVKNYN